MDLDKLLKFTDGGMHLAVFDGRYSDGYIALMSTTSEGLESITDHYHGGDTDWEVFRFNPGNLNWYPVVYGVSFDDAIDRLKKKLATVTEEIFGKWYEAVNLVDGLASSDLIHSLPKLPEDLDAAIALLYTHLEKHNK